MVCILCRFLINYFDPGWSDKADKLQSVLLPQRLNSDAIFEADPHSARLREIFEFSRTHCGEAFAQFLAFAEAGSVWSMLQVGNAYESGRGVALDRVRAEEWHSKAYEGGSDYGLVRAAMLAFRRSDVTKARTLLRVGVDRGLAPAMRYLAWMELKLSRRDREEARALYEQAIASGDFPARMYFSRAKAIGRFGLKEVPAGIRSLFAASADFSAQVDAVNNAPVAKASG
jgi:hypothetical protein